MSLINILHISDAHIKKESESDIKDIVYELCQDIVKVQKEKNITINVVCFSGDLIQSGSKACVEENQWELANELLISPVLETLRLNKDAFVIVPGNHEVDTKKIKTVIESGLKVNELDKIEKLLDEFDKSYTERLDYFYDYIGDTYEDAKVENLGYSITKIIGGVSVGFACIDSAWRSSGKGTQEKNNLYIGINQLKQLYNNIEKADLKVCVMHHPVDWLVDCEVNIVEKELSKFDIVLNGHIHENDLKQVIRANNKTIFSTAGKLFPVDTQNGRCVDGYNGYSVLSYDTDCKRCRAFIRTYYGMNRQSFDAGINICEGGEIEFIIGNPSENRDIEWGLINGIQRFYREMSEKFSFIRTMDKKIPSNFEEVIVEPTLSKISDYVKEKDNETESKTITVDEIIANTNKNQLFVGKRETGKTTLLQKIGLSLLDNYCVNTVIPLYVDIKCANKSSDRLFAAAYSFACEYIMDNVAITKDVFSELSESGRFVLLLDNFDIKNADHCVWLERFIEDHSSMRCFVTTEEEFFQSIDVRQMPEVFDNFDKSYIQYLGKNQIRQLVAKWMGCENNEVNEVVTKIDTYCNQMNFAKTPFNISIFMVIWDHDGNYIPTNEGILMQNYLEIVLEKLSPNEARRDNFSFSIKEDFLSELAYEFYKNNGYGMVQEEFLSFVSGYHIKKGYDLNESKFDTLFLKKNILTYFDDKVVFSRTSFYEYFLAVYAKKNKLFVDEMLEDGRREFFRNEICYYAGLENDCRELLEKLSEKVLEIIIDNIDLIDVLNDIDIITEFKMDKDEMVRSITEHRLSVEEADSISDITHTISRRKSDELKIQPSDDSRSADSFYTTLEIYAGVLKNAELLDNVLKVKHLEYYMYGMNMLYGMMIKMIEKVNFQLTFSELTDDQKIKIGIDSETDYKEMKKEFIDMTKMVFPVAIQNLILESVGTPKLKNAIDELIARKEECPFEKFMLVFLKIDLGVMNLGKEFKEYIKKEKSKSILKIIYMKLTYYYKLRVTVRNDKDDMMLLDLITDVYMRIYPQKNQKNNKSQITKFVKMNLDKI